MDVYLGVVHVFNYQKYYHELQPRIFYEFLTTNEISSTLEILEYTFLYRSDIQILKELIAVTSYK